MSPPAAAATARRGQELTCIQHITGRSVAPTGLRTVRVRQSSVCWVLGCGCTLCHAASCSPVPSHLASLHSVTGVGGVQRPAVAKGKPLNTRVPPSMVPVATPHGQLTSAIRACVPHPTAGYPPPSAAPDRRRATPIHLKEFSFPFAAPWLELANLPNKLTTETAYTAPTIAPASGCRPCSARAGRLPRPAEPPAGCATRLKMRLVGQRNCAMRAIVWHAETPPARAFGWSCWGRRGTAVPSRPINTCCKGGGQRNNRDAPPLGRPRGRFRRHKPSNIGATARRCWQQRSDTYSWYLGCILAY